MILDSSQEKEETSVDVLGVIGSLMVVKEMRGLMDSHV